jgi:CRP-like cAMP-binding protein
VANPLINKLERYARLSAEDRQALERMSCERVRQVGARRDLIREGDCPREMNLILSGWACRYRELSDGRRQIVSLLLPGDICDLNVFVLREMDHTISAMTRVTYAELPREAFGRIMDDHPRVAHAMWWEALVQNAIQREWVLNLGQRDAFERLSHFLCEVFLRLRAVGMTDGDTCAFPPTQAELAAALGLSAVHVNRTLQELRSAGLIVLRDKTLTIPDLEALERAALFNRNYLHLDREGAHLDANDR